MSEDMRDQGSKKPSRQARSLALVAGLLIGLLIVIGIVALLSRTSGA